MEENKKLWFKRKLYGWGWTPCSWEGWLVTLGYIILIVPIFAQSEAIKSVSDLWLMVFGPFIILTGLLIFTCYKKGEKPKWQWGNSATNDHPWLGVDAIILNDEGKILLEKRASTMSAYPGYWCLVGGWMEWGESVEDAVKREAMEEVGIEIEVVKFVGKYYDTKNLPIKKYSRVALPHICKIISGTPKAHQPEEVEEVKWFSLEEIKNMDLAYDQKEMLKDAVDKGLI